MSPSHTASQPKKSFMNNRWKYLDLALVLIGTQVIVSVVLFTQALPNMGFLLLGVLLFELGIFKLAPKMLPDKRKYNALRAQTDRFLRLVRQLNAAALAVKEHDTPENRQAIEDIRQSMQKLVEHLTTVAGKTDSELSEVATTVATHNAVVDVANPVTTANGMQR